MARSVTSKVATEFGETVKTEKKTFVSETRKDVLISRQTEAKAFKTLRYYNWSKSFGMKTPFLNNLANGAYGTLQLLNDFSAFTSDNVVRSLAARYGWVVAGRFFGKAQSKVLPQGGGPLGRFMRVKGGQFSRKVLGDFMSYFTTTELEFTNITKSQKKLMKELQEVGTLGPQWQAMALAEAIGTAPDPYHSIAAGIRKENRNNTGMDRAFVNQNEKSVEYLQKRTSVIKNMSNAGANAPEMTYLIKAMEYGADPDDVVSKLKGKDNVLKKILDGFSDQRIQDDSSDMFFEDESLFSTGTEHKIFEKIDKVLGTDLSSQVNGRNEFYENFHVSSTMDIGPKKLKYGPGDYIPEAGDDPGIHNATNMASVYSVNDIKDDNFVASRNQIVKGLKIAEVQNLHKKNPNGGFLVFGIEFVAHANIRDIQQIEYGGPATDRMRTLKNRTDRYVYPRSMFLHKAGQTAARKLGIEGKMQFSKRTGDVAGTLAQRRTKFLAEQNKEKTKSQSKAGGYSLVVDQKLRNVMKQDLIDARHPRVKDGNKVDFKDLAINEVEIQSKTKTYGERFKGRNTIYGIDENGELKSYNLDEKEYPPAYKNLLDRYQATLSSTGKDVSDLANPYSQVEAAVNVDSELRETRNLIDDIDRNELGIRRQETPTKMQRQNYQVRGGLRRPQDIVDQAIANARETLDPEYWKEVGRRQQILEDTAKANHDKRLKLIDKNYKKGSSSARDARQRAITESENEMFEEIRVGTMKIHDEVEAEFFGDFKDVGFIETVEDLESIKNPVIREEMRKIINQADEDIRTSGNRMPYESPYGRRQRFPFPMKTMKKKMRDYARAVSKGNQVEADILWDEMTDGGKISWETIQIETGMDGTVVLQEVDGSLNEFFPGTVKEGATVSMDLATQNEIVDDIKREMLESEGIKNLRDAVNKERLSASGLNKIEGVGGNVNKSKTNQYGNPTAEAAAKDLVGILGRSGMPAELVQALESEIVGKSKDGKQNIKSYGKGITRPYKEAKSALLKIQGRGGDDVLLGSDLGNGFESLNKGAGRDSIFKKPLTDLVEAAHRSEESLAVLHFILALEEDSRVVNMIFSLFNPNSEFGKRATGQTTARHGKSVSQRYGGGVIIDIAEVNRIKAMLRNTGYNNLATYRDIVFGGNY